MPFVMDDVEIDTGSEQSDTFAVPNELRDSIY